MLGVPTSDCDQLKAWSADFAEVLGNFQHNPDRAARTLKCVEEMTAYFRAAIKRQKTEPREGLINALMTAEMIQRRLGHAVGAPSLVRDRARVGRDVNDQAATAQEHGARDRPGDPAGRQR